MAVTPKPDLTLDSPTDDLAQVADQLHATMCQALSDPTRIRILYALREDAANVSDLASRLALPQSTVSRHLKVLRDQKLVIARREGSLVFYGLADERVLQALDILRAVLADILKGQSALAHAL